MVRRDTASNSPALAILTNNDDPPKLIKGSGIPVKGSVAVTTPTLIMA
jgi:hypothetical protein